MASASETEDGSLLNCDAVRRAACFCAQVVPPLAAVPLPLAPAAGGAALLLLLLLLPPPIPKPDTEIPAAPRRDAAAPLM